MQEVYMTTQQLQERNSQFADDFNRLSPFEKAVCWTLALQFGHPMNHAEVLFHLSKMELKYEGRELTQSIVKNTLKNLYDKFLDHNHVPYSNIQHQLVVDALNGPLKEIFLSILRLPQMKEVPPRQKNKMDLRIGLCLEIYHLNTYERSKNEIEISVKKILKHPFEELEKALNYFNQNEIDSHWIERLPLPIQISLHTQLLYELRRKNITVINLEERIARLRPYLENPKENPQITVLFLKHALNLANLSYVTPVMLESLNQNDAYECSIYASIKLLQGRIEEALEAFERATPLLCTALKRPVSTFLDTIGLYYLFTKLQYQPNDLERLFLVAQKAYELDDFYKNVYKAISILIHFLRTGQKLSLPDIYSNSKTSSIISAFYGLCAYWYDKQALAANVEHYALAFHSAKKQLPGIARILAELIVAVSPVNSSSSSLYEAYINETQALYGVSFLSLSPVKETWEMSLNALELLYPLNESSAAEAKAKIANTQGLRLAWQVNIYKGIVEGALEQKINAKGHWTKGRQVSLERLKTKKSDFNYATDHDWKVINTIESYMEQTYGYYKKEIFKFNTHKTFLALVGHPYILNQDNMLIEFVKGSIEVLITDKEDHYALSLSTPSTTAGTVIKSETETRFQIIEFTDAHLALSKIIGPANELLIPKNAKSRLQNILQAIEKKMPVHSDLDDDSERKEAENKLHVHLTPVNQGMKLNLFIRPFGDEGPYFKPGNGFQAPKIMMNGTSQRVSRNLVQERKSADALINSIEPLFLENKGDDEWHFYEPEKVLETLSNLQAHQDDVRLFWPNGQKFSVSPPIDSKSLSLQVKGNLDWFSLEGNIKIDEKTVIDLKTLLELIGTETPRFIPIGNSQFLALTDRFKQLLSEIKALSQSERGNLKIHTLSFPAISEIANSIAEFTADEQWQKAKERLQNAQAHQPVVPSTLQAELRPYQIEGFQWLSRLAHWGVGACLADDMGLGKTLQALALILEHATHGPSLVVAPTSVCHNWLREAMRFAPTLQSKLYADNRQTGFLESLGPMQLLITSYGLLNNESEFFSAIKWQTVILDEAQVIKNSNTKRSQAVMQLKSSIKVILTGTPVENRLGELWNLFRFINPGLLGSYESFSKRFVDPIEQKKDMGARKALKNIIQPFVLRRLKNQVLKDLPSRIEKTLLIPFESEELAFYEALRRTAIEKLAEASDEKSRIHILAEITRMRRACCHPSLVAPEINLPGTKLQYFLELVEELGINNHRALVFSQFVGCLEIVKTSLDVKGISYQYIDGSTRPEEREKRVNAFQNGEGALFLISLRAGGTGLNLTAADYVVHLDPWWNPAVEDQASDRAYRIGQTRSVTIYRLIMEGTIEEKMLKLHDSKRGLATDLLEGTNLSGKLTNEELLAMIKE